MAAPDAADCARDPQAHGRKNLRMAISAAAANPRQACFARSRMSTADSLCLALAALLLSVAANATDSDTTPGAGSDTLEEVVVTAQKRSQDVQNIGVAIDTASGAALDALRIQQPLNFSMIASSLSTMNSTTDSTPLFLIRGIGLDDFNTNNSSGVGTYLDDVFASLPDF